VNLDLKPEHDIARRLLAVSDELRVLRGEFAHLVHTTRPDLMNVAGSHQFRQQANRWAGWLIALAAQTTQPRKKSP
jgi:hypothetical protein